jgi:class 3 adenylate cyclase/alpha-beta hydrolase superfamily lysophospholipase
MRLAGPADGGVRGGPMTGSEVRYVNSGGVHIAYRVFGDGPVDLVLVPAFTSHLEQNHEWPGVVRWNARLVSFSRLIVFDKRSTGLSDHAPGPVVLEDTMQDVLAVLDAAGAERPAVCGDLEGAALSALFAATHPERTRALILYAPLVFPWALAPELQHMFGEQLPAAWGSEPMARTLAGVVAPSLADDQQFLQFMAKAMRSSVSPGAAQAWLRMISDIDVREALPQIRVPTLIVHRTGDRAVDVGSSRYAAGRIPGARLVELPDGDNLTFVGDIEAVGAEIEEFLTGSRTPPMPDRVLATILFTDIAGSTEHAAEVGDRRWRELLGRHDTLAREQLERYRGREVKMTGDGLLATFDGPARAVTCAGAIGREMRALGLEVRAAVHTGEVELRDGDIGGIGVHIAARVMGLARPNEVLVSSTVKDLVAGAEIRFEDRSVQSLRGVPGQWHLFAAYL